MDIVKVWRRSLIKLTAFSYSHTNNDNTAADEYQEVEIGGVDKPNNNNKDHTHTASAQSKCPVTFEAFFDIVEPTNHDFQCFFLNKTKKRQFIEVAVLYSC